MKVHFRYIWLLVILAFLASDASAQRKSRRKKKKEVPVQIVDTIPAYTVAINRQIMQEAIDKEQLLLAASDGLSDKQLTTSKDPKLNDAVTDALFKRVDWLQFEIETDKVLDNRLKANFLTGIVDVLKHLRQNWKQRRINIAYLPQMVATYKNTINAFKNRQPITPIIQHLNYDIAYIATLPVFFKESVDNDQQKVLMLLKVSQYYPERAFAILKTMPDVPFADSLIRILAHKFPQQLYNYAQANNKLSYRIQNIEDDPLITTVVTMARSESKSGQYYFPLLDNIVNKKITLEEIDKIKNDPVKYFRLLVNTEIEYVRRAADGDTAIGYHELIKKIQKKAEDDFVAKINGLHEQGDAIRFKSIQPLNAQELYYVAVLTDGLIYTSSYTRGVFPLMMKRMNGKGDQLLKSLYFDHYRKFISQAAAFNTLKTFLSSFSNADDANILMKTFVSGLEQSKELEDGVDVADSYASIYETMPELAAQMLDNVKLNYDKNLASENTRGIAIYNILYKLFLSADTVNHIDLTQELGIPPVYNVPISSLKTDKGEIVAQVFFYGDKDGRGIYNGFVNMFNNGNWTIDASNKQWVSIKSKKGEKISIYANKALPEENGEDDRAQRALNNYLEENKLYPSITIHRGHSYYAPTTISYMAPTSKVVFMGSCGGFILIDSILQKCDDAHIIASKQIGRTSINKPFFLLLTETLRKGNDIEWIPFWKTFKQRANVAGFEDYIPPYKNLGAIFIKAYKKETGEDG